ncbi:hypothetical protein XM38_012320 [Halomicronema hongdechloris C2206]|uniref:Uncharacterized protein n=1 Tax=Halomicronema hongdechloris C2206 TaxID=1641165 RepID=A0A1Z3HJ29_9CYAN|nr:hypothetical protein [Halomicronema hongdechloris]ASC70295.1 hypothetical protein XM38_012320 [Halomicronema hongdechloris C2206]
MHLTDIRQANRLQWGRIDSDSAYRIAVINRLWQLDQPSPGQQHVNQAFAFGRADGGEF